MIIPRSPKFGKKLHCWKESDEVGGTFLLKHSLKVFLQCKHAHTCLNVWLQTNSKAHPLILHVIGVFMRSNSSDQ